MSTAGNGGGYELGDVASDSLQNRSDSDVTYCGHKVQGYRAQVMETYMTVEDNDARRHLSLITHVAVGQAHESDAHALVPARRTNVLRTVSV